MSAKTPGRLALGSSSHGGNSCCGAQTDVDASVLCLLYGGRAEPWIGPSAWNTQAELRVHAKLTHTKQAVSQL